MTPFTLHRLLGRIRCWPVDSQQASRRNAMVACTALAQRRAEREDVEHFLASRVAESAPEPGAAHG